MCVCMFLFSLSSYSLSIDPYSSICARTHTVHHLRSHAEARILDGEREKCYSIAFASTCNLKPELYKLKHVFVVVHTFAIAFKNVCTESVCAYLSRWNFGSHATTNGTSNITYTFDIETVGFGFFPQIFRYMN